MFPSFIPLSDLTTEIVDWLVNLSFIVAMVNGNEFG